MAKRRQWLDDLKLDNNMTDNSMQSNNRKKIKILSEQVFVSGNLISTTIHTPSTSYDVDSTSRKDDCLSTPHQVKHNVKELTPTFRNPKTYIQKTKEILQEITPTTTSPSPINVNKWIHCDNNDLDEFQQQSHDLSCLNTPFDPKDPVPLSSDIELIQPLSSRPKTKKRAASFPLNNTPNNTLRSQLRRRSISVPHSTFNESETCARLVLQLSTSVSQFTSPKPEVDTCLMSLGPEINTNRVDQQSTNDFRDISPVPGTSTDFHEQEFLRSITPVIESGKLINKKHNPTRKCKKNLFFDKSFLDFVDKDDVLLHEAFPSEDSESWSDQELVSDSSEDKRNGTKKKTNNKNKKKVQKRNNNLETNTTTIDITKGKTKREIKNENEMNRRMGKTYINGKGKLIEEKKMLPNPCIGKKCRNDCGNIPEERRQRLFDFYWNLQSQQRRKDWISQVVVKTKEVKNSCKNTPNKSRRSVTYEYYINEGERKRQVCQQFLIKTLNITQRFILYTAETTIDGFAKLDDRGKHNSHNKTSEEITQHAHSYIMSLPLMPSHYCRKDSKKLYLSEDVKNITNLHNMYVKRCEEENIKHMSFKVFSKYFKTNYNIGFHIPKKDKCIICSSSKTYDVLTEEEMDKLNIHLKEKEESYNRFLFHQALNEKDKSVICASFDLQKVLNTPHGSNMALYYSRKIAVYNFTIYESGTHFGSCNVWSEIDAHRGANEISSCLLKYIKDVDRRQTVKTLLLYSDSCFGQNKNKTVLSMLRYALITSEHLEVIQINFLLPGHTYMPADSIHATIERAVRNTTVWAPSHWPTVIEMARKKPFPYTVTVIEGRDFMDFDGIINNTFKKSQKLMISQIRVVTFKKSEPNTMIIKHSMASDSESIKVNLGSIDNVGPKPNLYPDKLPISVQKYNDLKKLVEKKIIPSNCGKEYLTLKYNKKSVDCLPDTDEED